MLNSVAVSCVTSSKERRRKDMDAQSDSYTSADPKCGQVHDEILLVWLWALFTTAKWIIGSVPDQTLSCQQQMACLESKIPWKHLHPCQQHYTAQGFLRKAVLAFSDFSEEMVVFQLYLVFHIEIMSCGFENREIVAGLLVQAQICEPDHVLGRAVVGRSVKPSHL